MLYLYILLTIIFTFFLYNLFLILLNVKINKLEKKIIKEFNKRINLIPGLYETTNEFIVRHNDVFKNILKLRKIILYTPSSVDFEKRINNEILVHNELNFIFKVCEKNLKLDKNEKFNMIKDLFLNKSSDISKLLEIYKKITPLFNNYLKFKNITIIGIFININKKETI